MGYFNSEWVNKFCVGKKIKSIENGKHPEETKIVFDDDSYIEFFPHLSRKTEGLNIFQELSIIINPYDEKGIVIQSTDIMEGKKHSVDYRHMYSWEDKEIRAIVDHWRELVGKFSLLDTELTMEMLKEWASNKNKKYMCSCGNRKMKFVNEDKLRPSCFRCNSEREIMPLIRGWNEIVAG